MNGIGGAVATGDGDIMMRFLPTFQTVNMMAKGLDPTAAALSVIGRISKHYFYVGAIVAVNVRGEYGASCYGFPVFTYSVINPVLKSVTLKNVECQV